MRVRHLLQCKASDVYPKKEGFEKESYRNNSKPFLLDPILLWFQRIFFARNNAKDTWRSGILAKIWLSTCVHCKIRGYSRSLDACHFGAYSGRSSNDCQNVKMHRTSENLHVGRIYQLLGKVPPACSFEEREWFGSTWIPHGFVKHGRADPSTWAYGYDLILGSSICRN
jgi:hypothetical protein